MRLLRGLGGLLLWILAAVLGLVAVILCATVILLPLGIPLLGYARRLFTQSMRLMLPRAISHPVRTASDSARKQGRKAKSDVEHVHKRGGKPTRRARKKMGIA
jgi:hypothetical protein